MIRPSLKQQTGGKQQQQKCVWEVGSRGGGGGSWNFAGRRN